MLLHAAEHAPFVANAQLRSAKSNPSKILIHGRLIVLLIASYGMVLSSLAWATHYSEAGQPNLDTIAPHAIVGISVRYSTGCSAPGIPSSGTASSLEEGVQTVTEVMKRCISSPGPYITVSLGPWGSLSNGNPPCAPRLMMPSGECADSGIVVTRYIAGFYSAGSPYPSVSGEVRKNIYINYIRDQPQYTVRLSSAGASPSSESNSIVSYAEPGKTASLVARVYDKNSRLVSNVGVKLEVVEVVPKSGGHQHHDSSRPKGGLGGPQPTPHIVNGNTGSGGNGFAFTFTAPAPSGDHKIKATCTDSACKQEGPDTVWVGIKNLIPLPTNNNYVLIPNRDTNHPDNHYMTYDAQNKLMQLADFYRARFPRNPLLHINDASLERGGLFDIDSNWSYLPKGHKAHRRGESTDIRANPDFNPDTAIPVRNFEEFKRAVESLGGKTSIHSPGVSNQHFHVEF